MIELKHVSKSFADKQVLFDINAKFEAGKPNLIIGASGGGKSVLLKCMVGLVIPESGEIFYDGRDFVHMDYQNKKEVRQELGMLFRLQPCLILSLCRKTLSFHSKCFQT